MSVAPTTAPSPPGAPPAPRGWPRWFVPVVLAIPFAVVVAVLRGLTVMMHTFHEEDERVYHYPTILQFAHQWPGIDFVHYPAAQTPLFHTLMATIAQVSGTEIWRLRIFDVLISYGAALVLYHLLRKRRGLEPALALVLTLVVVLSPYVFGDSFLLMTDSLSLGLVIVALDQLERFRAKPRLLAFGLAALAICAAVLTRQSTAFMFVVAFGYLLLAGRGLAARVWIAALALLALAAVPIGALALAWGRLVPIGADTSSCGLCGPGRVDQSSPGVFVRSASFTLACVALYAVALFGPGLVVRLRRGTLSRAQLRAVLPGAAIAAGIGVVLLVIGPVAKHVGDSGWLWRVADKSPIVFSSALVFWVLVPLGSVALYLRWRQEPRDWLSPLFLGSFLLVALSTRLGFQKYYDPFALLALIFTIHAREKAREYYVGSALVVAGSIAYAVSFALFPSLQDHPNRPVRAGAPRVVAEAAPGAVRRLGP